MNNILQRIRSTKQRARGLTILELAIAIAVMGVLATGMFSLSSSMVSMYSGIAEERFKTVVRSALNEYYDANIQSDSDLIQLVGSTAPTAYTIDTDNLAGFRGQGGGDFTFDNDGSGNRWFYAACSTTGFITHVQITNKIDAGDQGTRLHYCDIIAYTTNNNTQIPALNGKTIKNWDDRAGNLSTVSDFVIVRGQPIVRQVIDDAWVDIVKTRDAMEAYYLQQYEKNRELGIVVSRFANEPIVAANADLYDLDSVFPNTEADSENNFDPAAAYALGLTDDDVSTALGGMLIDNSSDDVRHPENATPAEARPPYTAKIWYQLCKDPDCDDDDDVIIRGIASSGSP